MASRYCACTGIITLSAAARALIVSIPREGIQSKRIKSYCFLTVSRYCFRTVSRLMAFTRETSIPDSSILAGIKSTPSWWLKIPSLCWRGVSVITFPITVTRVISSLSGCAYPKPIVKLPGGSVSINRTFLPSSANPMPKLAQVVVLLTPPFWLVMAIVFAFNFVPPFKFWVSKSHRFPYGLMIDIKIYLCV